MTLLFFFLVQNRAYICTPLVGTSQEIWDVNIASKDCMTTQRTVTGIQMHIPNTTLYTTILPYSLPALNGADRIHQKPEQS